ncbi:response regulator, partial [Candidatus Poribacteria bacterium]|nr:response regulator [Candidatus Poribacteria bacterium]
MSSYNILLADTEVNNLKALARTLRYDYNIFPATNSESIPGIMEQKEIAVILSNYKMPGMDSVKNIEKILQPYSDTVSIILGPYTEAERMVNAVSESQIYSYITMPWEPEEIKAVVQEGIEAYELNRVMKKPYTRVLLDGGVITREQLEEAIKRQNQEEIPIETVLREKCHISESQIEKAREISRYRSRSMADALLEIDAVNKSDIEEAQKLQKSRRKKLVEILVELGYADEESIYSCYAIQLGIPYLSLDQVPDKPEMLSVLSSDLAYKHTIVPVDLIGKTIVVAAIEPLSDETKREIELETGYKPMVICSSYKDIHIALDRYCSIEEIPQ